MKEVPQVIDASKKCVPLEIAIEKNPVLKSYLIRHNPPRLDLGSTIALQEYNKTILQIKTRLRLSLPEGFLIPSVCLRLTFLDVILTKSSRVLEIGTGASAIMGMIAIRNFNCKVVGTERNPISIKAAQRNITQNNLSDRFELVDSEGQILLGLPKSLGKFDLIFSYPPQYSYSEGEKFAKKERGFQGVISELGWGENGVNFACRLVQEVPKTSFLNKNGKIALLLLNKDSLQEVREVMKENGFHHSSIKIIAGSRKRFILIGEFSE
ncbi:MAG: RlmF-related methyltransferase [Promethearchaeota archaeon]